MKTTEKEVSFITTMTTEEARDEYLTALKGLFQCSAGNKTFKSKVWFFIKQIEPKLRENMKDFYDKEEKYAYLINLGKTQAQLENKQYLPSEDVLRLQKEYQESQKQCYEKVLTIDLPIDRYLSSEELPTEESLKDLPGYLVSQMSNGYQQTVQYSLIGLLAILEYKFVK